MKAKISLFMFTMLLGASMAFAVNGRAHYTLKAVVSQQMFSWDLDTTYYLKQEPAGCTPPATSPSYGTKYCVASVKDTPEGLDSLLKNYWNERAPQKLQLDSDINLGQIGSDGSCVTNHIPLSFRKNGVLSGNGKKISNMCISATSMKGPMGFFESIDNANVDNLSMDNVLIKISGNSVKGADYHPVGAFVGKISMSTLKKVTVSNVSIDAPFAGGVVGLVENATLESITAVNGISVMNSTLISEGLAGSKDMGDVMGASVNSSSYNFGVFLGGIAGMAYRSLENASFKNDRVSAVIRNVPVTNNSAMGGLVGVLASSTDSIVNVSVTLSGDGDVSEISGGSAMGGLVGFVGNYYENNNVAQGLIFIKGVSFEGNVGDASVSETTSNGSTYANIYAGGLIGYNFFLRSESQLIIANSWSKANLKDSLKVAGKYHYYAGGILGASNRCLAGSDESMYVSIRNSSSTGSIDIAASAKEVDGIHMQTFVGGIAGEVCLASDGNSFIGDSSSMNISVNTKTAFGDLVIGGKTVYDSVVVGGMIGYLHTATTKQAMTLTDVRFNGSIQVGDSLNTVVVGGVLGYFPMLTGGKAIDMNNVYVRASENLIELNAVKSERVSRGYNDKQTAIVGGLCGYCRELSDVEKIAVDAKNAEIKVSGVYSGDSLIIGGLIGQSYTAEENTNISSTFTVGDILLNANLENNFDNNTVVMEGYLVGLHDHYKEYSIRSNYHYGVNDLDVGPFGGTVPVDETENGWMADEGIAYVVRNGVNKKLNNNVNGVEAGEAMQAKSFARLMNEAFENSSDAVWAYDENYYDLPFIAHGRYGAVTDGFLVNFYGFNDLHLGKITVDPQKSATPPAVPKVEGYTFAGWDQDFSSVTENMDVYAIYTINSYRVTFFDNDSVTVLDQPRLVEYGKAATTPKISSLTKKGYHFVGWSDSSYTNVKDSLKIYAIYKANVHQLIFLNDEDSLLKSVEVAYGTPVSLMEPVHKESTVEKYYTFDKWILADASGSIPALMPDSDLTVKASFVATDILYKVVFVDYDGSTIFEGEVKYGEKVDLPSLPSREGFKFVGWDSSRVDGSDDLKITALYDTIKCNVVFRDYKDSIIYQGVFSYNKDLTLANISPLNREPSGDYVYTFKGWSQTLGLLKGDVDVKAVYDSTYVGVSSSSSQSGTPSSSGAAAPEVVKVLSPKLEQSGNAVRLTFGLDGAKQVSLLLRDESGLVVDSALVNNRWEMAPAPKGKSVVELVANGKVIYQDSFEVNRERILPARSWQMVSVAAMDKGSIMGAGLDLYWWDEKNPVGDYWQYRAYRGGDVDGSRGFWAGTAKEIPVALGEFAGSADSEIVWDLDSVFSGWNLVANPYGWSINLSKGSTDDGSKVTFWHWNSEKGSYGLDKILRPYEAVWVKVDHATKFRVAATPVYGTSSGEKSAAEKRAAMFKEASQKASDWSIMVTLSDENGKSDSWNVLGAGSVAETMDEPPSGMGDRVNLSIRESDQGRVLAKSVKPVAESYEWFLDVSANTARDGKLAFDGVETLNAKGYSLYVTADGVTRNVDGDGSVAVALKKESQRVRVRVAASNAAAVASAGLSGFNVMQNAGTLQVGFDADEALAGTAGRYALVGVDGKKVAGGHFAAVAGSNVLSLQAPKSGLYFLQVKLGSQMINSKVLVK